MRAMQRGSEVRPCKANERAWGSPEKRERPFHGAYQGECACLELQTRGLKAPS